MNWIEYERKNELGELDYYQNLSQPFNKTIKEFFEQIYGADKTIEEHIQIIKDNNIRNGAQWKKYGGVVK